RAGSKMSWGTILSGMGCGFGRMSSGSNGVTAAVGVFTLRVAAPSADADVDWAVDFLTGENSTRTISNKPAAMSKKAAISIGFQGLSVNVGPSRKLKHPPQGWPEKKWNFRASGKIWPR